MLPNAQRMFNFDLGETAQAIRQTGKSFSANEIAPRAAEIDKSNQFPRDLWPKIGALGLHGITVEEEYGGGGPGDLEHFVGMEGVFRAAGSGGPRVSRALRGDGGDFAGVCVGRSVLWRAFQSLHQSASPQRQRSAEAQI